MSSNENELPVQVAELRSHVRHLQAVTSDIKAELRVTNQRIDSLRQRIDERFGSLKQRIE